MLLPHSFARFARSRHHASGASNSLLRDPERRDEHGVWVGDGRHEVARHHGGRAGQSQGAAGEVHVAGFCRWHCNATDSAMRSMPGREDTEVTLASALALLGLLERDPERSRQNQVEVMPAPGRSLSD